MKPVIEYIASPMGLIFLFLGVGSVLTIIQKHLKYARVFVLTGVFLFLVFGSGIIGGFLLYRLECEYPPFHQENMTEIEAVVLLSSWATKNPKLPGSAQLDRASTVRLCEAIRLLHLYPNSKLIITGGRGSFDGGQAASLTISEVAVSLGVPSGRIICEDEAQNTYENALFTRKYVDSKSFALVTSALHMHRAMAVFQGLSMNPVAAPTDYRSDVGNPLNLETECDFFKSWVVRCSPDFPNVQDLEEITLVIHELLGRVWYKAKYL